RFRIALQHGMGIAAQAVEKGFARLDGDRRGGRAQRLLGLVLLQRLLPTAQAHYGLGQIRLGRGEQNQAIEHFRKAADAKDETGKRASVALARLDLPRNPGAYFATTVERNGADQLLLVVRNTSPVPVAGATIEAVHSAKGRETYRVGALGPGAAARIALPWNAAGLREGVRIGGRVVAARIAE
ncbi:MAG: tetratricopeptide repeat protein, partial [Rhodocyclales bacterium]|nr:tetratricopeptide repeat protein [Rhodocyclales bacterium]